MHLQSCITSSIQRVKDKILHVPKHFFTMLDQGLQSSMVQRSYIMLYDQRRLTSTIKPIEDVIFYGITSRISVQLDTGTVNSFSPL